ncbi:MAG TPA: ABC transporter ATP-binding protein [Roseiflexaceae bacterium]|nr:ABC transporter ATP-binding protein [Roseiflexaceae bacterium]
MLHTYWGLLATYLRPQRIRVTLLGGLLIGSIALQLVGPQIIRTFIDTAQSDGGQSALLAAALLYVGATMAQRLVGLGTVYVGEQVGWSATNALRADLLQHLLRLELSFHGQRTPGELIERLDGDVTALGNFFSQLVITVLGNALLVLGILVLLFREDWRVGMGIGLYAGLTLVVLALIQRIAVPRWAAAHQAEAEQFGFIEERLHGTEDIRANGAVPYVLDRLRQLTRARLVAHRAAALAGTLTTVGTNLLSALGYAAGLALGAFLYSRGEASIGTAFLITAYVGLLASPLEAIRGQIEDLQRASASILRVGELRRHTPALREDVQTALPAGPLAVEFDAVSFGYLDRGLGLGARDNGANLDAQTLAAHSENCFSCADPQASSLNPQASSFPRADPQASSLNPQASSLALHHLSFQLRPGEVLGVLGHTGSGKTTLTRLLFRLYDPSDGAVRLSGCDLRGLALDDLRGRVGMVTQDVQLFQASVRDNLTFFDRSTNDDRIRDVLAELGLGPWLATLPQGLDTPLLAGSHSLSAGQAQLLACARVFLKDPGLVILDEASSRLDPLSERLLERAFDRLLAGRTGIIIAHRLATVQRTDRILILEGGRAVEFGLRAELLAEPDSRFARLMRTGLEEVLA